MTKDIDMTFGGKAATYVEGIHPDTGEVLRVKVAGNFPFKDPVTNKFIIDDKGSVVLPGRERERFARLDASRQEVPDPRPMSSAVAFAADLTPEEEVLRLIATADRRMAENYARAEESDIDFFDDDDFAVDDEGGVDNMKSPFEFVRDAVAGVDVPRALHGAFNPPPEPVSDDEPPLPLPPTGKAAKRAPKASPEPVSEDEPE